MTEAVSSSVSRRFDEDEHLLIDGFPKSRKNLRIRQIREPFEQAMRDVAAGHRGDTKDCLCRVS